MRQILYVSDSGLGTDVRELDRLMLQCRTNNSLDGITGLLWTDGKRFAQAIEGGARSIEDLLAKLRHDPRHHNLRVVEDRPVPERQFGEWAMIRPASDTLAQMFERRIRRQLDQITGELSRVFKQIIDDALPEVPA